VRRIRAHVRLAVLVAVVLLLAAAAAVLGGSGGRGSFGTGETAPDGARAVATLLGDRGVAVVTADSAAAADHALATLPPGTRPSATVFVTSGSIARTRLSALWATGVGHVVLVDPAAGPLSVLTGRITAGLPVPAATAQPGCSLPAADQAGGVAVSGSGFLARSVAFTDPALLRPDDTHAVLTSCYTDGGRAWLVRRVAAGRTLDVLGSADFLTNGRLAADGDAALALDLLGSGPTLVWLRPSAADAVDPGTAGNGDSLVTLVPHGVWAVVAGLSGAGLLLALSRARRLGPLVPETLPVVVRASETARGRARLYRRSRARATALAALREAAAADLGSRLGVPASAGRGALVPLVAERSGRPTAQVARLLAPDQTTDDQRTDDHKTDDRTRAIDDEQLLTTARELAALRTAALPTDLR
jgi:hypothetical protein